jgi:hypothetical protein
MASYKYGTHLRQVTSDAFDKTFSPGQTGPWSGIYRCVNCGDEIAANGGNTLPPQNHHQHADTSKKIIWKLLVFAVQKK